MILSKSFIDRALSRDEVRQIVAQAAAELQVTGKRVLTIIPDGTRTMPMPLMFQLLQDEIGTRAAACDYLVALGTHPLMSEAQLTRLIGRPVVNGACGDARIFNHRWDLPGTFADLGTIPADEVAKASGGLLSDPILVKINRMLFDYDQVLICGPVFPHEVVGFSGGNKYLFPGVSTGEMINQTHWLGALLGSYNLIGTPCTPVRALIDQDHGLSAMKLRELSNAVAANAKTFTLVPYDDPGTALAALRNGGVNGVLTIPPGFSRRVLAGDAPQVALVEDNTDNFVAATLASAFSGLLDAYSAPAASSRRIATEPTLDVVEIYPYVPYIQYLLPGSIVMSIFMMVMIGGGIIFIDDKARGLHEGYLVTPISRLELILGFTVSGAIKAVLAATAVMTIGSLIAGVPDPFAPLRLLRLFMVIVVTAVALVSMMFLLMVRMTDPLLPRAMFGALNTLLWFPSGAVYPQQAFPGWMRGLATIDPFTYSVHALKSLLLKNTGVGALNVDRLRHYVRTFVPRIARPVAWVLALMRHEMAEPTPLAPLIAERAIMPRIRYLSGLAADMLGLTPDDPRVKRCVISIQSQCLFYAPDRFREAVFRGWPLSDADLEGVAHHIAEFSIAGIRGIAASPIRE